MRALGLACLMIAVAAPASAADCSKDVLAAFEKQRTSKVFRVEFSQPSAEGEVHMVIDYMPPDKMLQTVTSPAMPGEQQTMLIGNRAYAGSGGAFEELLPQFTQSIIAEFASAVGEPKNLGDFECVGNLKIDDQDFVAYRLAEKAAEGADPSTVMARTVYVDPASGKPAYNIIAALGGSAPPALKVKYSYPTDVEIVAPANAPVQKLH
ncbi:MAG: hypothetical protein J0H36_11800 [Hyphomicrobium denitrificans]|nr:hypothetical protein [Hyphomicrobium denitrificans]MBN9354376.1 hypothetical protein [Hyphomicrobium denitrificans]